MVKCVVGKKNLITARVSMLLKSRAPPDMLPFSLCNKKSLAIRHTNRLLFPTTLSIPSYDIENYVGLRTYQHPLVYQTKGRGSSATIVTRLHVKRVEKSDSLTGWDTIFTSLYDLHTGSETNPVFCSKGNGCPFTGQVVVHLKLNTHLHPQPRVTRKWSLSQFLGRQ